MLAQLPQELERRFHDYVYADGVFQFMTQVSGFPDPRKDFYDKYVNKWRAQPFRDMGYRSTYVRMFSPRNFLADYDYLAVICDEDNDNVRAYHRLMFRYLLGEPTPTKSDEDMWCTQVALCRLELDLIKEFWRENGLTRQDTNLILTIGTRLSRLGDYSLDFWDAEYVAPALGLVREAITESAVHFHDRAAYYEAVSALWNSFDTLPEPNELRRSTIHCLQAVSDRYGG